MHGARKCVSRFQWHGFAFVIHERDSGRVVMARGPFRHQAALYRRSPRRLRFASALPALVKAVASDTSIDVAALHNYMTFHAVVPPRARS